MRELSVDELSMVSGGDGILIPGGGYVSTTRTVFNTLGAYGALATAGTVGWAVGSGVNRLVEQSFGYNAGDVLYDWLNS